MSTMGIELSDIQTKKSEEFWFGGPGAVADRNGRATIQEIVDQFINLTCGLNVDTELNADAPNTADIETLCMDAAAQLATTDNYTGTLNFYKAKDTSDSTHVLNQLYTLLSTKNSTIYVARRNNKLIGSPIEPGDRFEVFKFTTAALQVGLNTSAGPGAYTALLNGAGLYSGHYLIDSGGTDVLQVAPSIVGIEEAETTQLTAYLGATDVTATATWTSVDPAIATVGASTGLVTGVAAGSTIVVASNAGQVATSRVIVTA